MGFFQLILFFAYFTGILHQKYSIPASKFGVINKNKNFNDFALEGKVIIIFSPPCLRIGVRMAFFVIQVRMFFRCFQSKIYYLILS